MIQLQASPRRPVRGRLPGAGYVQVPFLEREFMKIHEYQGKEILRNFGVPVPSFWAASTASWTVNAGMPRGTGTPKLRKISLP